jgi:hypothetical protein
MEVELMQLCQTLLGSGRAGSSHRLIEEGRGCANIRALTSLVCFGRP